MTHDLWLGLAVCIVIFMAVGTTALALDAWGNRNTHWVDKQIKRVKR